MNLTGFFAIAALEGRKPQMPRRWVDLNEYTPEETARLAVQVITELTEEQLFELLAKVLTHEQKGELATSWMNE